MYKFTRNTIANVNYWLVKNGFGTFCKFTGDWEYLPDDEIIGMPKFYDDNSNIDFYFMETMRKLGLKPNIDAITISFLHELGHYMTLEKLSNEEYDECNFTIDGLSMAGLTEHDFLTKYWEVKSEKMANEWLVKFSNKHSKKCQELEDLIYDTMKWEY